jgi:hypothetical protein
MKEIRILILDGLLPDLKRAESSYLLSRKIKELHHIEIAQIERDISIILHDLSYTELILSLARLYDRSSKRYPTRCLEKLHHIVEGNNYQCKIHKTRSGADDHLQFLGFNFGEVELMNNSTQEQYGKRAKYHFESIEQSEPLFNDIQKLREIRDKILAHNENIELDPLFKYESIENLIGHAKNVISFYSVTYTGMSLMSKNRFFIGNSNVKWAKTYEMFHKKNSGN